MERNLPSSVRFAVVSFVPENSQVAVVGGCQALGSWNPEKALQLSPNRSPSNPYEPTLWTAEVDIGSSDIDSFEYKFIRKRGGSGPWEWEGSGAHDNRRWVMNEMQASLGFAESGSNKNVQYCGGVIRQSNGKEIFALAPTQYIEPGGVSEYVHTTTFYNDVKNRRAMHYNTLTKDCIVGSCPRSVDHIRHLRSDLKVTCVFNLQTHEDAVSNYPDPDGVPAEADRHPDSVFALYEREQLCYVWLPAADMSTASRTQVLPQAAMLLKDLIDNGHKCYVHCNAGVGRSVAAACGYLMFILGYSMIETHYAISSARPCAFFDAVAMRAGYKDFKVKFPNVSASKYVAERKASYADVNSKAEVQTAAGTPVIAP